MGVAVAIITFGVVSNVALVPPVGAALGSHASWFGVAATATCALSAAMCLSRAVGSRASRLLGASLLSATFFMVAELSVFEPRGDLWGRLPRLLWPAIPTALAFWARAMFAAAGPLRRSRDEASSFWQTVGDISRRVARRRVRWYSVPIPLVELAGVWLPCLVFACAGLVPGLIRGVDRSPERWPGWVFEPAWLWALFAAWTFAVLGVSALVIEAAWKSHAHGVFAGVLVRARGARLAAKWAIAAVGAVFVGTWTGWWPEPMLDVPIAGLFAFYAVRSADIDSYRDAAHAYSSMKRRWIWSSLGVAWSVVFVAFLGRGPFVSGCLAAMLAAIYPVAAIAARAQAGVPQAAGGAVGRVDRLSRRTAEAFASLMSGSYQQELIVNLRTIELARVLLEGLRDEEFRMLIGGLPTHEGRMPPAGRDPREHPRLRRFVGELPMLDGRDRFDARLERFVQMFYETVMSEPLVAKKLSRRDRFNPSNQQIIQAYCLERITFATSPDHDRDELWLRLKYRLWFRRGFNPKLPDGRPVYEWAGGRDPALVIELMNFESVSAALGRIVGRPVYEPSKKKRDRAILAGVKTVRARWLELLEELEHAARERAQGDSLR